MLRCTDLSCHSRAIVELRELEEVVRDAKSALGTRIGQAKGPKLLDALIGVRQLRLGAGLPLVDALTLFRMVLELAPKYDPKYIDLKSMLEESRIQGLVT